MKIRRFLSVFLLTCLLCTLFTPQALALEDPDIHAKAAILVDGGSGTVLYDKNIHEELPMASITKVMSALLVLEAIDRGQLRMDQEVTASQTSMQGMVEDGSTADIKVGETLTVEQLLYCMLVISANETCNILGEAVSGTVDAFVAKMNQRAQELGCKNTHFANTTGLTQSGHYSSAWDIYLITQEAMKHDVFMTIVNTKAYTVPATNMTDKERELHSTNALISNWRMTGYLYSGAQGIKTGTTDAAGHCLVSSAIRGSRTLISVVLGCEEVKTETGGTRVESFSETARLFDWGFDNFADRTVLDENELICEVPVRYGRDSDGVTVRPAQSISAVLPSADTAGAPQFEQQVTIYSERDGKPLKAPVKAGDEVGELTVSYNGTVYGTVKLVAAVDVAVSKGAYIAGHLRAFFTNPIVLVVLLLVVLAVIGYVLWLVRRRRQIEAERKRRRRAQLEAEEARRRALAHETLREFDRDHVGSGRR